MDLLSRFARFALGSGASALTTSWLYICSLAALGSTAGAQFAGPHVISQQVALPWGVFATDLDGDGDEDVLSGSAADDKVAWYENLGGGIFGPQRVLWELPQIGPLRVHAADLDADGDADVLGGTPLIVTENLGGGVSVAARLQRTSRCRIMLWGGGMRGATS